MPNKTTDILLVEDNPADVRLVEEAFKESELDVRIHTIEESSNILNFLSKEAKYKNAPSPDLILLDLNMPRTDGHAIISELKSNDSFRVIPLIVFSSSSSEKDIHDSYQLGANCYLTKPTDFDGYTKLMKLIEEFWFHTARIPEKI